MPEDKQQQAIRWLERELYWLRRAPSLNGCRPMPEWLEQIEVFETCLEALRRSE